MSNRIKRRSALGRLSAPDAFLLRAEANRGTGLTPVKAANTSRGGVHLGFEAGTHDTYPLCGALDRRAKETTDEPANCTRCGSIARELGLGDLLEPNDWMTIYAPRSRR
jgi:hypothetical protein